MIPAFMSEGASQPTSAPTSSGSTKSDKKLMGALSYLGLLFIVPLLTDAKNDPDVQFHIKQGIVLFVVEVVMSFIPFFGWAIDLVLLFVSLYAAYQAYQGVKWELPLLGQYAKKIKL